MAPFRNPFGKKPPTVNEIPRSGDNTPAVRDKSADSSSEHTSSRPSSSLRIKLIREPEEFKMGVVNDSGVYLPPSPPDKKGFWRRTPTSTTASSHRSGTSENEPFSISRASFDSYRRSFDISARSPVSHTDHPYGRQSLDSRGPRTPQSFRHGSARSERSRDDVVDEEVFEDVGLSDEPRPRKKGLFGRFTDNGEVPASDDPVRPASIHSRFHLPGRKRGQSGQGSELGDIPRPTSRDTAQTQTEEGAVR